MIVCNSCARRDIPSRRRTPKQANDHGLQDFTLGTYYRLMSHCITQAHQRIRHFF